MSDSMPHKRFNVGDAAVEGLLNGIIGGLVMALTLTIFSLINGDAPAALFSQFATEDTVSPAAGALLHLAVSGVYGMVFGVIALKLAIVQRWLPRFGWLIGLAYGVILWAAGSFILLPATGSPLLMIPSLLFGFAHLVYGIVLGVMVGRTKRDRVI
jgi:hypothetical protein